MDTNRQDAHKTKKEMLVERGIIKADPAQNLRFQQEIPRGFSLNLCSHCNYRCRYCPQGIDAQRVEFLKTGIVEKLFNEIAGRAAYVQISARGESLLHPEFFRIIDIIKQANPASFICLNTNGSLIDGDIAARLIDSRIDQIQISLQTIDPDLYKELTGSALHSRVVDAVIRLAGLRTKLNKNILLTVQGLDVPENRPYKRAFFDFCYEHHLDFHVQQLHSWGDKFESDAVHDPDRYPCPYLFLYPTINHKGAVNPCFIDFHAKYTYGFIGRNSLADIWHSKRARDMREMHLLGRWNDIPMCRNCQGYRLIPSGFRFHDGRFDYETKNDGSDI